jgi:hypothetical protein
LFAFLFIQKGFFVFGKLLETPRAELASVDQFNAFGSANIRDFVYRVLTCKSGELIQLDKPYNTFYSIQINKEKFDIPIINAGDTQKSQSINRSMRDFMKTSGLMFYGVIKIY